MLTTASPDSIAKPSGVAEAVRRERLTGCLLGTAVGDALGLPFEGLSPRRIARWATGPLRMQLVLGYGMVSDDTDHTVFVAQALLRAGNEPVRFGRVLAWRLRLWLLCLPAGIGLATLRGIVRLWLGFSPQHSGVYSAGNGPSMRSALIGAVYCHDPASRQALVTASTRLTHTDPRALAGALAVAEIAARLASGEWSERPPVAELLAVLRAVSTAPDWQTAVTALEPVCDGEQPLSAFAHTCGGRRGVSGYVLHSVPVAIAGWYRHFGDYRSTLESLIRLGGDTDTVAAIAGALAGIQAGPAGIPADWRERLRDWPHSPAYLAALATALTDSTQPIRTRFALGLLPRNLLFLPLVLGHGLRRLLPPWG